MSKICITCNKEHERKISKECKSCVTKRAANAYVERNKDMINAYQEKYRESRREFLRLKSREYYWKDPKSKNDYGKKWYLEKHGLAKARPKRAAGDGNIDAQGYKTITKKDHPNAMDCKGRIREHIYVMSQHLGRPLMKGECVHHLNGIRHDNRIENLELWHKGQPPGQRVEDKIRWCIDFLTEQGYKVIK